MNLEPALITEEQAAHYLSVSVSFLQKSRSKKSKKIALGEAPTFRKHGGSVKYHLEDLKEFARNLPVYGLNSDDEELPVEDNHQEDEVGFDLASEGDCSLDDFFA